MLQFSDDDVSNRLVISTNGLLLYYVRNESDIYSDDKNR